VKEKDENIPAFLRISQEERNRAWRDNPPRHTPTVFRHQEEVSPETARVLAEIEAEKKLRAKNRKETKEALKLQRLESTKGKVWDMTRCRWVDENQPSQEKTMSASSDLVKTYNDLVARAVAAGIKAEPTKKFKSLSVGEARIKKLQQQLAPSAPPKPATKREQANGITAEFNKRAGSLGDALLRALDKERGRQVSVEKLCVAVYGGADDQEGALAMVLKGLQLACPKHYEIRKEKGSIGLYDKK